MKFEVLVKKIDSVENHPNADRLSINRIGGYVAISNKVDGEHRYQAGQLVVYVPEGAVVPEAILKQGYWDEKTNKGILAGPNGDRVKAIKLRDVLSQGLILPLSNDWKEGDDVADLLGITKYEPEIPTSMGGEAFGSYEYKLNFDVEDMKKYPDILSDSEIVVATEKLHGTCCVICVLPEATEPNAVDGQILVSSKGLAAKGVWFKDTPENRKQNLYLKVLEEVGFDKLKICALSDSPIYLIGEIYGVGVQDLHYSTTKPQFALFDIKVLDFWNTPLSPMDFNKKLGINVPSILYMGRWEDLKNNIEKYRDGVSSQDGKTLKEGIVIRPLIPRNDDRIGRVILKAVSPDYLVRKGGTEYQ